MTRDEANERHRFFFDKDPFPLVPPALLNSREVANYINTVGMVFPFKPEKLNGITLNLSVGAIGLYWDEQRKKVRKDISLDKEFVLKSNTIAYVAIREELRLPQYIISRFNLRVTNAYRGILLGTGPIVDPGFEGRLFIPLHNLTNNEYVFQYEEDFIDMEFTKLNPIEKWLEPFILPPTIDINDRSEFKPWGPKSDNLNKIDREIEYYLRKANLGRSIDSSLPSLKNEANVAIEKANKTSDKVETSLSRYNVGLIFSFAALLTAMVGIINVLRGDIKEIKDKKFDERIELLERKYDSLIRR